jgi:hypothetical protein
VAIDDVCVPLNHRQRRPSAEGHDDLRFNACFQQVGGERVAKRMEPDSLESGARLHVAEPTPKLAVGDWFSIVSTQQVRSLARP